MRDPHSTEKLGELCRQGKGSKGKVYMHIHTLLISQFLASVMLPPQHYGHLSFNPHLI
jgi:hypothetical protein